MGLRLSGAGGFNLCHLSIAFLTKNSKQGSMENKHLEKKVIPAAWTIKVLAALPMDLRWARYCRTFPSIGAEGVDLAYMVPNCSTGPLFEAAGVRLEVKVSNSSHAFL